MEQDQSSKVSFRDRIGLVNEQGKRVWIYAKRPKGQLYNFRILFGILLLVLFFGLPHLSIDSNPMFEINVLKRHFIFFGNIYWPQDIYIFFLAFLSFMVFIILFTVIYGRLFCGWACPQTLFMELVYRNIEYLIEGNQNQQRKLNQSPWTWRKIGIKFSKHSLFWLFSLAIAFTVLSYLHGGKNMVIYVTSMFNDHTGLLIGMFVFATVIYMVYAKLRELVCTIICPYGRLQGVLLDPNSTIVAYDYKRGEPRTKLLGSEDRKSSNKGDCVECMSCVQVCPAGIDIRNGTQLECTHCTACIDACNHTMKRVNLPQGLIRYASERSIREGKPHKFTWRMGGYSFVLLGLLGLFVFLLAKRTDIDTNILKTSSVLPILAEDGKWSNLYNIKVLNKTPEPMSLHLEILNHIGVIKFAGTDTLKLEKEKSIEGIFFIYIDSSKLTSDNTMLEIGIFNKGLLLESKKISFTTNTN